MPKTDNPFSTKPFGEYGNSSSDPFQDETVPAADGGAWSEDRRGAWGGSGQPATIPLDNGPSQGNGTAEVQMDYIKRKDQLDLKEKELAAREAELAKQRKELEQSGALKPKKNWPRCYPITYHDISKDVPEGNRRMVRNCYFSFLGFVLAVTWNWFGALMALCVITNSRTLVGFLLASIYWTAGVPGAWILWYMRIYNVAIRDRALVYAWFFFMFAVHEAFCIWSAVSPPMPLTNDWSHTGFVTAIKAFSQSTFVGVVYIIGGVFWSLEALWGFWAIKGVYSHFRSGNGARRAQQEAASAAAGAVASRAVGSRNFGAGDV